MQTRTGWTPQDHTQSRRAMHRGVIVVAILATAVLVTASPAAAETMIQLRYWPNTTAIGGGMTGGWQTASVGVTLRRSLTQDWALSFEGDWGGQSNWSGNWLGGTSGSDSYWSLNLHRTWGTHSSTFSLFAGYMQMRSGTVFPESPFQQTFRASGFRLGADSQWRLSHNWSLMLMGAVGVGLNGENSWPGVLPTETTSAQYYEYSLSVSYAFARDWSLDLGYRGMYSAGGASPNYMPFTATTTGFVFGITRMMP